MKHTLQWQARALTPEGASPWFPARVPGNVQADYGRFMGWGDINVGCNVEHWRACEGYTWEYRADLPAELPADRQAVLVALGIDYCYDILLDGVTVLSHEGMFSPVEVPLPAGSKEVVVRIAPHPIRADAPFVDRQQADHCVKPPVCYEWDWHPRMLVSGIWQDIYVELRGEGYIHHCEPFYAFQPDGSAKMWFETECAQPVTITLYDPQENLVGEGSQFTLANPQRWQCNGQGEPALYRWEAVSSDHALSGTVGFRTVSLAMTEGAWKEPVSFPKGRSVCPIQLVLNDVPVFAKGSNWVNPDIFLGEVEAARYEQLVTYAKEAHMNIFRCWGGSGVYPDSFYDACDRLGIMVWVEFPLACNAYPDDDHYLTVLEQEARAILQRLRRHPSVVLYCGGNELFNNWSLMTDQSLPLRLLNKLCYEEDRSKPFLTTSPVFGMGHGGYTFYDPDAHKDVFTLFQDSHCTAYTEFGVPSVTDADILRQIIPEEELFPIADKGAWRLHHAFGAWGDARWLCMDVLTQYAPEPLDTLEKVCALSQWLQCEGYKAIFEEARRQAPYCAMAINWCYCEPWVTAAGNSLMTYPTVLKPAYYAVQSALRPVMGSARIPRFDWQEGELFTPQLWWLNDSPAASGRSVTAWVELGGQRYDLLRWNPGIVEAHTNKVGPTINWGLPKAETTEFTLHLEWEGGETSYRLRYRAAEEKAISRQMNV